MESGIEVATMTVGRQEPSSSSTMRPTSTAAIDHFVHDIRDRILHEARGVVEEFHFHALGHDLLDARDASLDPVDHLQGRRLAALHHDDDDGLLAVHQYGVRLHPAGEAHHATSRRWMKALPSLLIGMSSKSSIFSGDAFVRTIQSVDLILMSPPGSTRFCLSRALWMSAGGEVTGEQFLLIEIDHHLHVLAPVGMRQDRARYRDEQGSDSHDARGYRAPPVYVIGGDLQRGHRHLGWEQTHDHGREISGGSALTVVCEIAAISASLPPRSTPS